MSDSFTSESCVCVCVNSRSIMVTVVCVTGGLVCPADDTLTVTEYFLYASRCSSVTAVTPPTNRSAEVSSPSSWRQHSTS